MRPGEDGRAVGVEVVDEVDVVVGHVARSVGDVEVGGMRLGERVQ